MIADTSTKASSLACGIITGNYLKNLIDLASWVGRQYIDHLMDTVVFNKLSKSSQVVVLATKTIYFSEDMHKRKANWSK